MILTSQQKQTLKRLIAASAKANNAAWKAETALNDFCEDVWGYNPGDRDCDAIIDGCMGGCGASSGMSVEEFIEDMNDKE